MVTIILFIPAYLMYVVKRCFYCIYLFRNKSMHYFRVYEEGYASLNLTI